MKELQIEQIASEPYSKTKIGNSEIPWKRALRVWYFLYSLKNGIAKQKGGKVQK
jgi:hypothetical protein